jgi:hypothetical protein
MLVVPLGGAAGATRDEVTVAPQHAAAYDGE